MTSADYKRREVAAHRALGLCRHCTRRNDGETQLCARHREYQAQWKRAYRARRKAS